MPIVTISRESYSPGKEVAEKVAQRLGFACVSGDVLGQASEEFDVPEAKLLRAVRDAPAILDRFTFGKERYLAYFQAALLEHFQKDNVVYHGLAGHYVVRGVPHVLKVRIIGKLDDRVAAVMQRASVFEQAASSMSGLSGQGLSLPASHQAVSREKALRILETSDEARRKWGMHLYGIDTHDPILYDLVIHINKLDVDDAADAICYAAGLKQFQATPESQQAIDDLLLAALVKARLIEQHPRVNVSAHAGNVYVAIEGGSPSDEHAIQDALRQIQGAKKVDVDLFPFTTPD